jgi:YD repeat-containing protein
VSDLHSSLNYVNNEGLTPMPSQKKVTDQLNQTTEYTYDSKDNLLALKDAKNQVTTFEYDKNNRLKKETRPMGQQMSYQCVR